MFHFVYCKQDHIAVPAELDLVEEEDQITHLLRLEEAGNTEDILSESDVMLALLLLQYSYIILIYYFQI